MLKVTANELSALTLVLQFVNVEELLKSAMGGFVDVPEKEVTESDKEKSDLCWKAIKAFL